MVSIQPWFKMASKSRAKSDTTADNSSKGRKSANRHKAKQSVVCPICDENIVDATSYTSGQDAIFCDGLCKEWLHCQCAGLSKAAFTTASQSQDPFFCLQCCLATQSRELPWTKNYWQSRTNYPILWVPLPLHYCLPLLLPTSQTMRQLLRYRVTYLSSLNILDNKALIFESNTLVSQTKSSTLSYMALRNAQKALPSMNSSTGT